MRTALRDNPGTLRLTVVRLAGQYGDGVFQAALSGAILFNPERRTDPLDIAGGFAALLLPYSFIGPYAGALLDRWDRRTVLTIANLLRVLCIAVTAACLYGGMRATPLLALALAVIGIGRFVGTGVSAALPRVLAPRWLVPMNSILATIASGCTIAGVGVGFSLIGLIGAGDRASAIAVAAAASGPLIGALVVAGFPPRALGPGTGPALEPAVCAPATTAHGGPATPEQTRTSLRAIASGLREGARSAWRSREVTTALLGIGAHRIVFGADTLLMVLVLRRGDAADVGTHLAKFSAAVGATGFGMFTAAAVAPLLIPRLGRPRTVVTGLITAVAVQLCLVTPITVATGEAEPRAEAMLLAAAFLLGLAGQVIKLTGDAAMQIDIDDTHRGQVFALQDTVFNTAFVLAVAATALVIPGDGRSPGIVIAAAAVYCAAILAIAARSRCETGR